MAIEGKNGIYLVPLNMGDVDDIFCGILKSKEHLKSGIPFIENVETKEHVEVYITMTLKNIKTKCYTIRKDTTFCGIINLDLNDQFNKVCEIGYWLTKEETGKGVMTNALFSLSNFALKNLHLHRVELRVETTNFKSQNVAMRNNFVNEGIERKRLFLDGKYRDCYIYSLLDEDL
ncbi:ribosomal protein-serine acetyltransferase, putative [Entamoeba invadens IP1]|uniref:Ribosomal protein-serine acetyltransferase, putative n=1 Tax=Entamoeba invadens IP1 TaxID=370355 RepID=A0A0A1U8J9_ENTIV|nr:ribosomal protein-serine acetyltransferase, putative [Entamoeba invadens IP1]ELP91234.1 ribosomal protein-serine acetyltransferase, putative [Entamoeba invadens IP1]|eukprot:XP_004258005.1 ribosomal protein-serine acetyltransferase, putative [Entamoeba invadens IP1]